VSSPDTKPAADIALAVVTRDRAAIFARCIAPGLERSARDGGEIVVVDQSLDDATARHVAQLEGARHLRSGPGLSVGRNVAVAATAASFVAFTDDDVILPAGWLIAMRELLAGHPGVGAVCGRARLPTGERFEGAAPGTYRWPRSAFRLGSGFNFAFRREALTAAGPFDELLGAGARFRSAEDTDMLYRVLRAGWAVVCSDEIDVVHDDWRPRSAMPRLLFGYGIGTGAQSAKHHAGGDEVAAAIARGELGGALRGSAEAAARLQPVTAVSRLAYAAGFAAGYARFRRAMTP
jgi:GT2 family glycosyltransferase